MPQSILYDNTRLAVARILGDGRRKRTRAFTELQSHYLFEDRFGRPGKGNDKGKVEGMVGYVRRNFLVPAPRMESFEALNAHLERSCLGRMDARLRGHDETIGQRMERDLDALLPLPSSTLGDACDKQASRVSSLSQQASHPSSKGLPGVAPIHQHVLHLVEAIPVPVKHRQVGTLAVVMWTTPGYVALDSGHLLARSPCSRRCQWLRGYVPGLANQFFLRPAPEWNPIRAGPVPKILVAGAPIGDPQAACATGSF